MRLTEAELLREAAATGFRAEVLEKVIQLIELLETLRSHPFLKTRLVLKGGTALNLFVFDVPRLSVDINLNYIGSTDSETMLAERPKVEQAVQAVCGRLGIQVSQVPTEHAGGKWRLSYRGVSGRSGTLGLDVNYLLRSTLWPHAVIDSRPVGPFAAAQVPVLNVHELAAGKLAALFSRNAGRDLFDVRKLLQRGGLEPARLRLGFVVYGGINRRDWRDVSIDDVQADPGDVHRQLAPMLRGHVAPVGSDVVEWTKRLVADCRDLLSIVLPLEANEQDFLERLNDRGEIIPELLTDDTRLRNLIRSHPGLLWKALNVRKHHGLGDEEPAAASDRLWNSGWPT